MRDAAARYCEVVESADRYGPQDFLVALLPVLTAVVAAGAAMPVIVLPDAPGEADYELPSVARDAWDQASAAIGRSLAGWDIYWMVDPLSIDDAHVPEILAGSLNDDLAEIWSDLKAGLLGLAQGGPAADIEWEWRYGFYTHWGSHATHALTVLHARMQEIKTREFRVT